MLEAQEILGSSQRVGPPGQPTTQAGQSAFERYRAILVVWLIGARVWRRLAANRGVTAKALNFIGAMSLSRIRYQAEVAYLLEPRQTPFRLGRR